MLFYMEEQSHEEVAQMLAMPIGTVKTLLHRATARASREDGVALVPRKSSLVSVVLSRYVLLAGLGSPTATVNRSAIRRSTWAT